jgi:hypothetical protein
MPYTPTYRIEYTNELMQPCYILFSELDGAAESVLTYAAVNVRLSYSGDEGKFASLIGSSLEAELHLQTTDTDPTLEFIVGTNNQWLCEVFIDPELKPFFKGYVLADEGGWPFQDLPYTVKVTAVDGIGLLKDKVIEQGTFESHHSMMEYTAHCLKQTGLTLPIRVYDNVYHKSYTDRNTDINSDMWAQTFFEYRTFQKDATTFVDCYEALEILTKNTHRIFQWNGMWVIARIGNIQFTPFVGYYTDYDADGLNPVGVEILENYAQVGKSALIFPINENQIKYIKKAVKNHKTVYNFEIWPELPKNNKFERGSYTGTTLALDDSDMDGDDDFTEIIGVANNYTIDDWEWGEFDMTDYPNFTMTTGVTRPQVRKVFNDYDLEIVREVSIPASPSGVVTGIKSEVIPVVQGDRIKFSIDKRYSQDIDTGDNTFSLAAIIYIIPTGGGAPWYLLNSFTNPEIDGNWYTQFIGVGTVAGIFVRFGDIDARRYTGTSVESQPIPVSGDMRIIIVNPINNPDVTAYYRGFELEYLPMVAGGFQKVKGDSWNLIQTTDYPDKSEREIKISNNLHKVFKGCMLDSAGVPLTPEWYRLGVDEEKDYKQLINFMSFNLERRRMDMIEGDFKTLMYYPENNQEFYYPIGLHKQYRFVDIPGEDIRFMLSAPLELDLISCWMVCRWYEVYDDSENDGQTVGTEEFKYLF